MRIPKNNYGISRIRLSNFKSIDMLDNPMEIELSDLTLLCGENSSGKSTLLHSILLSLQALNSDKNSDSTFPLNGNIIKLNDVQDIIHFKVLPEGNYAVDTAEYIVSMMNEKIDIGIDLITHQLPDNELERTVLSLDVSLIPNVDLSEEAEGTTFNGVKPFPLNGETHIKSLTNPESEIMWSKELKFTNTDAFIGKQVHVFDSANNGEAKRFDNKSWTCEMRDYTIHYPDSPDDKEAWDLNKNNTFNGVDFISGIPSKVSYTVPISDFLAGKITDQVRSILENYPEFVEDQLFESLKGTDGFESYTTDRFLDEFRDTRDETFKPSVLIQEATSKFCQQFEELSNEQLQDHLKEFAPDDINSEDKKNIFSLNWNILPWKSSTYKDYYRDRFELATDLIKSSSQDGLSEYAEIFEGILYDIGASLIIDTLVFYLDNDDPSLPSKWNSGDDIEYTEDFISDDMIADVKSDVKNILSDELDQKFYIELESQLSKRFNELFDTAADNIFLVESFKGKNLDTTNELTDTNKLLKDIRFAATQIKYIGPLRMLMNYEPRVDSFDKNIPMGLNGEHFFNFYEEIKYNKVSTRDIYELQLERPSWERKRDNEEITIEESFNEALRYFGIADGFSTKYDNESDSIIGNISPTGIEKTIKMKELGVGFSQLAPIILLCLSSKPGTSILLEQPELHLHPQVQQKFADFIIEMTTKNKLQIILETHSDHILNRIRRRIAQAKLENNDPTLFNNCSILFAERENGNTNFRKATLSESGTYDFTDYPKGFFDQGAEDAFFILKASMEEENN